MKTLTATLVGEIRQRSRSGTVTVAALAKEYGVSRCAISNAAWGISFAHVPWDGPPQWKYPVGPAGAFGQKPTVLTLGRDNRTCEKLC